MLARNGGVFSVVRGWHPPTGNSFILSYSRLAYAIHEWEALAYIRDWHPSQSRIAYASQEQALRPPIREWHMPFVNGRLFVVGPEQI